MTEPSISVVVPVRDGGATLACLIEALRAQTVAPGRFELILADDGSCDGAAARIAAEHSWVTLSPGPPLNSYAARNRGAALARAPMLAFTDADCIPAAHWLEAGLALLAEHELLAGRVAPMLPGRRTTWSLLDMRSWHDMEHFVRAGSGVTANLLVRRELFERLGGFDDTLASNADDEFVQRCIAAAAAAAFTPDAWVGHPTIDRAVPYLRKQWFRHRWVAVRETRAGRRPPRVRMRYALPLMTVVQRRRLGLPLAVDRARCAEAGIEVRLPDRVRCALVLHSVLAYWTTGAQCWGWWIATREARADATSARRAA